MELRNVKATLVGPSNLSHWYLSLIRHAAIEANHRDVAQQVFRLDPEAFDMHGYIKTHVPDAELLFEGSDHEQHITMWSTSELTFGVLFADHGVIIATFVAADYEIARKALNMFGAELPQVPEIELDDDVVPMNLWMWNAAQNQPNRIYQQYQVPSWQEIAGNYPQPARDQITHVMGFDENEFESGRVILLHGPPGTGKTHVIRALAREWDWAEVQYITDAEQFFQSPLYIMQLVFNMNVGHNVLVIEDCGEFLTEDSDKRNNQSLARLLNLADGILGQNLNLSIIMTTNERVDNLHPAITRPGRCAANIEVGVFSDTEADEWLRNHGMTGDSRRYTLAEMYAIMRASRV